MPSEPTPSPTRSTTTSESDVRVLASLAELRDSLGKSDAGTEIEHAIVRELQRLEEKLRETSRTLLRGAVDELRVQAHLAVLEAHDRFAALEPFLRKVLGPLAAPRHVLAELGEAKVQVALAAMELRDAVEERQRRAHAEVGTVERATEHALERLSARIDALTQDLRKNP